MDVAHGRCSVHFDSVDQAAQTLHVRGLEQQASIATSQCRRWLLPAVDTLSETLNALSTGGETSVADVKQLRSGPSWQVTTAVDDSALGPVLKQLGGMGTESGVPRSPIPKPHRPSGTLPSLSISIDRTPRADALVDESIRAVDRLQMGTQVIPMAPPPTPQGGLAPPSALPIGEALVLQSLQLDALSQTMSASRVDEQTSIGSGTIDFSRMARLNL